MLNALQESGECYHTSFLGQNRLKLSRPSPGTVHPAEGSEGSVACHLQDIGQPVAGPSGRTARATTVARDGQENAGDVRNRQAGPSSAPGQPAEKEPQGPCPNRWACSGEGAVAHMSGCGY